MKSLLLRLVKTESCIAPFIVRVTLGLAILPHGLQKTIGLFGGYGFSGTMGYFTGTAGLPWLVAFLVIMGESLGALSLVLGVLTRFSASSLIVIMIGAISTVHWQHGFFMNWMGNQPGEGFEYHLLVIGMALSLIITGAGRWSADEYITTKIER